MSAARWSRPSGVTGTERAWAAAERLSGRWDDYVATVLVDAACRVWAGPDAVDIGLATWHVLTAANPDGAVRPDQLNREANRRLGELIAGRGFDPVSVIGSSADGTWREESFAVSGLDRAAACELGHRFGQAAIFELTVGELRVLRCPDAAVMRSRPRSDSVRLGEAGGL